jgi:hypothetical protein
MGYDRYKNFRNTDGTISSVPFIKIPKRNTDIYVLYELGKTRMDILSYDKYGDSSYGWLILQANPEYGSYEFEIPDGVTIRVPYPLNDVLKRYDEDYKTYKNLYGVK